MSVSLIVCSRNRADRLPVALERMLALTVVPDPFELVLVDSGSSDATRAVMRAFAERAPWPVVVCEAERPGLGYARNVGVRAATGELLVFTDDDCYIDPDYFRHLLPEMGNAAYDFGAGDVRLFDPSDAAIGVSYFPQKIEIAAHSVMPPGWILGANFFFLRHVFLAAGLFREDLGSGTPYPCEDVEMVARALRTGFTGVVLPQVFCHHHHGRRVGSPSLERIVHDYNRGSGAYYAIMLAGGTRSIWDIWAARTLPSAGAPLPQQSLVRLQRELKAAAAFLGDLIEGRSVLAPPSLVYEPAPVALPC